MRGAACLLALALCGACRPPEAERARGGGPGGDGGNRGGDLVIRQERSPYHGTPRLLREGPASTDDSPRAGDR